MKRLFGIVVGLLALNSFAETLNLQGMHCGGCAKMVEESVCKNANYKTCKAKLTNAKKQEGTLTIETTDGQPVNQDEVAKLLTEAGDYKINSKGSSSSESSAKKK